MSTLIASAWIACGLVACAWNGFIEDEPFQWDGDYYRERMWIGVPIVLGPLTLLWIIGKLSVRSGNKARQEKQRLADQVAKDLAEAQAEIDRLLKRGGSHAPR